MKLNKLKLDFERAKRNYRVSLTGSFLEGGRDVFTLIPDAPAPKFKSALRQQTRLLETYPGVVLVLREDAYRVGHDMKSAIASSGILDTNHSGLWAYKITSSPDETTAQENLAHVHAV